ncbi:hypothetical protein AB0C34_01235 [Nocardia sp. NPDC049220]|uniref:hypothetical protein n=1 Tax=Nocardia sp. NPDC049220 TaxID=3155273 RepID=UPI0033F0C727
MNNPAIRLFEEAVKKIADDSEELAEVYAARLRRVIAATNDARSTIAHADLDGARILLGGAEHATGLPTYNGLLRGVDPAGRLRVFGHERILSFPLRGPNTDLRPHRELIGLTLPKEPKDIPRMARWALQADRTSERGFHLIKPVPSDWGGDKPRWDWDDELHPGPWYNPDDPVPPIIEHVHANPNDEYGALVNTGIDEPELTLVRVNGATLGEITYGNDVFQAAIRENPRGDLMLVSCSPAARSMAAYMHEEAGFDRTIHAFNNEVQHKMYADYNGGKSQIGVKAMPDATVAPIDMVSSFPPPSGSPSTPWTHKTKC